MCGICGLLRPAAAGRAEAAAVTSATDEIRHRGPDHGAVGQWGPCTLGYRRLSVIDLATGDQPVTNEEGDTVAVFNGEIYNYRELRAQLEAQGHDVCAARATRPIAASPVRAARRCVRRAPRRHVRGGGLGRAARQRLVLARDRFGKKPLLWTQLEDGTVAFASELKALLTFPGVRRQIELERLDAYLALGYVPGDRTALRGINRLPPGSHAHRRERHRHA